MGRAPPLRRRFLSTSETGWTKDYSPNVAEGLVRGLRNDGVPRRSPSLDPAPEEVPSNCILWLRREPTLQPPSGWSSGRHGSAS